MGCAVIARALLAVPGAIRHRVALLKTGKVGANESPMVSHVVQVPDRDPQTHTAHQNCEYPNERLPPWAHRSVTTFPLSAVLGHTPRILTNRRELYKPLWFTTRVKGS